MNRRLFLSLLGSAALGQMQPRKRQIPTLPTYSDVSAKSHIAFRNRSSATSRKYLIESMTGGVALFDYDGDGNLDIYLVNGAALEDPMPKGKSPDKSDPAYWNRLYRNNGDGTFSDVTEKAGVKGHSYSMGVAVGDFDNDGRSDLYVTNYGRNILYRNNGDGTFTDVTERAGVACGGWSAGACFVDIDGDGLLDLVVSRYVEWDFQDVWCGARKQELRSYCHPDLFGAVTHVLYRNNGDGTFTDISSESGFANSPGKGLGVAFNDVDCDGLMDIIIANDSAPQQLFRNAGGRRFEETGLLAGMAYDADGRTFAGMGIDVADYDNDGWPDVFVNALANQKYALFRNNSGMFEYVTHQTGLAEITLQHSGWGAKFVDYDNDGWKDLFVAQGHVMDNIELTQPNIRYLEPLMLARNQHGKFTDVSASSGEAFKVPLAARGVAFGDLNNNGFIDAVINCNNGPAVILSNNGGNGNHWLLVNLVGTRSNRDGIGARLHLVSASGRKQFAICSTAASYLSASDKRVHFGLGPDAYATLLEVTWPSGKVQKLKNVAVDQILTITEPA